MVTNRRKQGARLREELTQWGSAPNRPSPEKTNVLIYPQERRFAGGVLAASPGSPSSFGVQHQL